MFGHASLARVGRASDAPARHIGVRSRLELDNNMSDDMRVCCERGIEKEKDKEVEEVESERVGCLCNQEWLD
jgi:predicted DNA-binding ribbon-helix-helix protein